MYQPVSEFRISDSEIPKSFSIGLGFDAVGVVTEALINPDFNLCPDMASSTPQNLWRRIHPPSMLRRGKMYFFSSGAGRGGRYDLL